MSRMTRDQWTAAFIDTVLRAKLGFSGFSHRYLSTVALQQAVQHQAKPPEEVAEAWMASRGAPEKKKP
jgi:hypothetical protein